MKPTFLRALLSVAAVLFIQSSSSPAAAATNDDFFSPDTVHQIRLRVHPSDWQRLKADFQSNTYYPCVFEWHGVSLQAGIRSAGLSTRSGVKPAMRVDFNRYDDGQTFLGLKSVRLKNLVYDASMVKERAVMLFYRRMGLPAPRTAHSRLYVNDQYAGLYLIVESIDKPFLQRTFAEDGGYLYKYENAAPYRFEYLGPDLSKYTPLPFEPHTHEDAPNAGPLVVMIRTMNMSSSADFPRAMSEYLDLKLFLSQLAVEMYFAEADGIMAHAGMANFYLYQFKGKNLFQFIAWDKDRTFFDINDSIWRGTKENVLTRRALESPELRQSYMEAFWKCAALAGSAGGWLEQEIVRDSDQVRDAVREDSLKYCPNPFWGESKPCTDQDFEDEVSRIIQFARERSDVVKRELAEASFEPPAGAPLLFEIGPVSDKGPAVLVPGSLVSVFGQGFADTDNAAAPGSPLPTTLGGVSVLINGIPAPLLFVSSFQVNLQVPWEIAPGKALVTVASKGVYSRALSASVGRAAPALLAVAHADGIQVSPERPAGPGETLQVFATGLGPVTGGAVTGQPAPADPLIAPIESPSVMIGGLSAEVVSSGLAAGLIGVFQINTVVPEGMGEGSMTLLTVAVTGQTSAPMALPTREH
jgi:uncharacterized protein (TIGR03437 family)